MELLGTRELEPRRMTYLRLSITDRCDMKCVYCTPYRRALAHAGSALSLEEVALLVCAFAENGVTKVRLTGGEPLLRRDIVEIVESVSRTSGISTVGVTTNGARLAELAKDLVRAGLQRVNVSLDSLNRDTFRRITGRDTLDEVLHAIDTALECGFEKVKINTVVMRGVNDSEISAIADLARQLPVEVRFIELMPLGHTSQEWKSMYVPATEIRRILRCPEPLVSEEISSARRYVLQGGKGIIGIISPMSEHFCDGCNRMRVTSSGKLKPCLRLSVEEDIRPLLRRPDLAERLGVLVSRLSCHKLTSAAGSAVQAEAMCAVGG